MAESQATSSGNSSKMATGILCKDTREVHELSEDINITDLTYHATPCLLNGNTFLNRQKFHSQDQKKADSVENKDALYIKVEMAGYGKEDVSISVDKGVLSIKSELQAGSSDQTRKQWWGVLESYFRPVRVYKIHDIKAVMKNGLLKVVVPRDNNKQDAYMGFFQVKIN